jgi:NAD-dependent deacetylase
LLGVDAPDARAIEALAAAVRRASRVLFITGAGVSADSGLPTYRGVGGLYEEAATEDGIPIEVALSGQMLHARPDLCWKHIYRIEEACRGALPNPAHEVIAGLQELVPDTWVLTQNVDGLHRRAGSRRLIEIHGDIHDIDCTRCAYTEVVEDYAALSIPPACPECGALVRPRVVLFGEMLPEGASETLRVELRRGFDVIVSVGTTSAFPYIAAPVIVGARQGAFTVEINPGRSEVSDLVALRIACRAAPALRALWDALDG